MINLSSAIAKIEETNTLLFEMQEIIKNISNKTNVINGIVTKTELLSLNASIEAARAGEFGKGFAVVAEEVGDLAKTSGIAAKDIENLIAESVQKMNFIIEDIKSKISDGVVSQKESSGIFNKIATNIEEMRYKSISNQEAMDEQKIGIENTTTATNSLSQTTHANTEASKNALIASEKVENDSKNIYQNIIEIESLLYGK
jgi:methyl-accepting chemotaxis protein